MSDYRMITLQQQPEWKEWAARWFHEKWNIPLEAYLESMEECIRHKGVVPQWYIVVLG